MNEDATYYFIMLRLNMFRAPLSLDKKLQTSSHLIHTTTTKNVH